MKDLNEIDLKRNNLASSSSPYLRQHVANPVWWQEWSNEVLDYASSGKIPLLVSVGYATCHWCHVMASEAFSDPETAGYLNEHYVCIKIDREQRPDIDQYMMDFINKQNGRGGWPLNVFMTPTRKPVYALTYAPVKSGRTSDSFLSIAEKVFEFIELHGDDLPPFEPGESVPVLAEEEMLITMLSQYYDSVNGGFGTGQKFPGHSTLLYLLYNLAATENPDVNAICAGSLDAMRLRGLNDHLQGGIFRYCVDSKWTIPHFEKMLYDQAMALWTYSLAYRVMKKDEYKIMAVKILKCLDESFLKDGVYITAHDADTHHDEGATYLWSYEQLLQALDPDEFSKFSVSYQVGIDGNFDGRNHLIRLNDIPLRDLEEKLLSIRKKRPQPSMDDKILSGQNAMLAISLIQAGRLLDMPELEAMAAALINKLIKIFWDGKTLGHSYWQGHLLSQGFLSDAAPMLAAVSMLYEADDSWEDHMTAMTLYVESFRNSGKWMESVSEDFLPVAASWFDHPVPSAVSMAEFALIRTKILKGEELPGIGYRQPFQSDFYNICAMINNGLFHVITSPQRLPWSRIPVNSIQVRGAVAQDCYMGSCTPLFS